MGLGRVNCGIVIGILICCPVRGQDTESEVACYLPSDEALRVERLREAMAVVDLAVGAGDAPTNVGLGVIDASCLSETRAPYRDQTIRAIREAIARATERASQCLERLRIIEMPDVISVLERTRYKCVDPEGDGLVASMRRTSRTYDSCGRGITRYMAGAHRRYEMTLSAPGAGLNRKLNESASTALSTEELASFLAHEAMHVLAMNNRDWHNSIDLDERGTRGCGKSLFEDRIYFTQAACFPESPMGLDFYSENGPYQCAGLCESALTGVDDRARLLFDASTEPGSERTGAFGASQVARPYPPAEAARICERIRATRGSDPTD